MSKLPFTINESAKLGINRFSQEVEQPRTRLRDLVGYGLIIGSVFSVFYATPAPAAGSMAPSVKIIRVAPYPGDRLRRLEREQSERRADEREARQERREKAAKARSKARAKDQRGYWE